MVQKQPSPISLHYHTMEGGEDSDQNYVHSKYEILAQIIETIFVDEIGMLGKYKCGCLPSH